MTFDTNPRAVEGGNLTLTERLADEYAPLLADVRALADRANMLPDEIPLDDQQALTEAANIVREARSLEARKTSANSTERKPHVERANEVTAFFGPPTIRIQSAKSRAETLINDRNKREQAAERERRAAAAEALRLEEQRRLEAAANLETAGNDDAAEAILGHAQAAGDMAARMERAAPTADLVRTNAGGTVSSRTVWKAEISEQGALRKTLGPLGDHFPLAELEKAVRAFMNAELKAGRLVASDDGLGTELPGLPGAVFTPEQKANVR